MELVPQGVLDRGEELPYHPYSEDRIAHRASPSSNGQIHQDIHSQIAAMLDYQSEYQLTLSLSLRA